MTSPHENELWSEHRQAAMSTFEARMYRERAGLEPAEALKWWEQYIFSAEAARAISAGWTLDDAVQARQNAMSLDDAVRFGVYTGLSPTDVLSWSSAGVTADEAVEALAAGWSLDETMELHPSVSSRLRYLEAKRRLAVGREPGDDTASRELAEIVRAFEAAEAARSEARSRAEPLCEIEARVDQRPTTISVLAGDDTVWVHENGHRDLGDRKDFRRALSLVADHVQINAGTIVEVRCLTLAPDELLTGGDALAPVCARQVVVRRRQSPHRRPSESQVRSFGDPDSAGYEQVLVLRTTGDAGSADLAPAIPDAWPGYTPHSDSIVSVGAMFLVLDPDDDAWLPVGRFDTPAAGRSAAELRLADLTGPPIGYEVDQAR